MARGHHMSVPQELLQKGAAVLLLLSYLLIPFSSYAQVVDSAQASTDTTSNTQISSSDSSSDTSAQTQSSQITTDSASDAAAAPEMTSDAAPAIQSAKSPVQVQSLLSSSGAPPPDLTHTTIDAKFLSELNPVTGSLDYTYAVNIPPGRNGLQPSVDLKYSSQPGSNVNILGYGWDTNTPYIVRINKQGEDTLYSQNYFYSTIDGELYQVSASSTIYGARVDNGNFNQYQLTASSTWILTDKNGNTYTFGTTSDARQDNPSNSAQIYKWMLEKVQDANGNYISYQYSKDKGEIYPQKITYTNASSTAGIFEVNYATTTRSDIATSSASGFPITSRFLISGIQAKVNGTVVRDYTLTYSTGVNGVRSVLSSIVESAFANGVTTTLPATKFTYKTGNTAWSQSSTYTTPVNLDTNAALVDANGDSLVDIIQITPTTGSSTLYINTGTDWAASTTLSIPTSTTLGRFVDVNGDHLSDYITASSTYMNTEVGWIASSTWNIPTAVATDTASTSIQYVDVNGDGLPDIVRSADSSSYVYLNTGLGWATSTSTWSVPVDFTTSGGDNYVRIVDVNGDGLPDLIQSYYFSSGSANHVWINNGGGWVLDPQWSVPVTMSTYDGTDNWYDTSVRFADINGDGLTDIIKNWSRISIGGTTAWLNTGSGWVNVQNWNLPIPFTTDNIDNHTRLADVNGDGMIDEVGSPYYGPAVYFNNGSTPDLLSKVTYPQGGNTSYAYQSSQLYLDNSGQLLNPQLAVSVGTVSGIAIDNGLGVIATSSYSYQGGKYYYNTSFDREFGGFQKVVKTDAAGNITSTYYHQGNTISDTAHGEYQDNPSKIGKAYRTESYDNGGNLYKKSMYKWDMSALSGERTFVNLIQQVDSTYNASTTHKDLAVTNIFDSASGNLLSTENWGQVTGSDDGSFTDVGVDDYTTTVSYASSTSPYLVLPSDKVTTDHGGNTVNERQYYYDSSPLGTITFGNLTKLAQWISGTSTPTYASTTSAYNSYGLVTSRTDPNGRTTSYGYDSYNLYPTTTTNALSQNTYTTYDYGTGQIATTTDTNGNKFTNVYDGLGRVVAQYQPSQTIASTSVLKTQYVYNDVAGPSIEKINYLSATTSTVQYNYFDGLGRIVQSRFGAPNPAAYSISYLIVGGGGGGGSGRNYSSGYRVGAGGGGGGVLAGIDTITSGNYPIAVGPGGNGGDYSGTGGIGGNSSWNSHTANGGGGGGTDNPVYSGICAGTSGGSGGGGGRGSCAGGSGSQGGNGGNGGISSGGGGGAGGNGSNASGWTPGNGGPGILSNVSGTTQIYGGGGGGSTYNGFAGSGGSGGGGAGIVGAGNGGDATYYGGGGGGAVTNNSYNVGGVGYQGIVILSYPTGSINATGGTVTTSGSTTIRTFTSNDIFTVNLNTTDFATKDYQYNNLGLLSKESLPYFSNSAASTSPAANGNLYKVYNYDPVYHVKAISTSVGSTTYAYNNWTTTVTDPNGNARDLSYDAYGNLVGVTEHNGGSVYTTSYGYDGNKNLTSLTDTSGNIRAFTYDGLSRELSAQDLHAASDTSFGTWTYIYDPAGNKTSVTDPKSQTINYTYDALNRVLTEDYTDQTGTEKTFAYDSCANGIGQLCSVSAPSAVTTYQYDLVGGVASETETIGSASSLKIQYVYDQQGNVTTQTYPDGSIVNYLYNGFGQLSSITEKEPTATTTRTIVADITYGPDGQFTYQRDGNSVETFNTYDPNALYRLTQRKTVGPGTGHLFTPMQSMMMSSLQMQTLATSSSPDFSQASVSNPMEVTSARTSTTKTFFLGAENGKLNYDTQFHVAPQFAKDGSGNMIPISSLTQVLDGKKSVTIRHAGYSAEVIKKPSNTLFGFTGPAGTMNVAFSDSKANTPVPTETSSDQGTVFTYANALGTGQNLEVISTDGYLQKNIVLSKKPVQTGTNANYTVTFKLSAGAGTGALDAKIDGELLSVGKTITSSEGVILLNASGTVAYILPPSAHDASTTTPGHQISLSAVYQLKSDGIYVTKQIPYSWLSTASYPVRADLTFSNFTAGGDGTIGTQPYPGTWATQHADTVGQSANTGGLNIQVSSHTYNSPVYLGISRGFVPIDTSSLPDNAVVSSSTLYMYVSGTDNGVSDGYNTINLYQGFQASSNGLVNSDISKCGDAITNPTKGSSDITISAIPANAYLAFPLNTAGKSWISATTSSKFCFREGHDAANIELVNIHSYWLNSQVTFASSVNAGTTKDPYIDIVYSRNNTAPATSTQLRVEDQTAPSNVTDTQPHFSATYNDIDAGDTATSYQIQIAVNGTGFASPIWDSGKLSLSPAVAAGYQSQNLPYTGTAFALDRTTYYYRIKFWDAADNASPWTSGSDYFTMADDGTHIQSLHYTYDAVGNITGILDDVNGSEQNTYTYDPLNRLITASSTVSGFQTPYRKTYSYDPLGNIVSSTDLGTYTYTGNIGTNYANPDAVTAIGNGIATTTYSYDNNGNLTSDGISNYVWDYLNRLSQVGKAGATSTYAYDYQGNRVQVTDPTGTTYYPNKYYSATAGGTTKNIYANGVLVASIGSTGTTSAATSTPTLNATTTNFTLGFSATSTMKTWTHKTSFGNNRLLVLTADILQHTPGIGSISSASYAGLPLTRAASTTNGTIESELWYLAAPPSGLNTMSITMNGSTDALKFSLADYTGANQSSPLDAVATTTGSTGNPSISVTAHNAKELVVSTLSRNSNAAAITNRTSIFSDTSSTTLAAASYQVPISSGAISDTYTGTASQPWSMISAAFVPSFASSTVGTTSVVEYIHPDHLSGTNVMTDSTGLLIENLQYYPYGSLRSDSLVGNYAAQKRKYIGQIYDNSTGLNYLNARYQNPIQGQFVSEDPVFWNKPSQQQLGNPQSLNAYSYAENNPITKLDPNGLWAAYIDGGVTLGIVSLQIGFEVNNKTLNAVGGIGPALGLGGAVGGGFSSGDIPTQYEADVTRSYNGAFGPGYGYSQTSQVTPDNIFQNDIVLNKKNVTSSHNFLLGAEASVSQIYSVHVPLFSTGSGGGMIQGATPNIPTPQSQSISIGNQNTQSTVRSSGSSQSNAQIQIQILQIQIQILQLQLALARR